MPVVTGQCHDLLLFLIDLWFFPMTASSASRGSVLALMHAVQRLLNADGLLTRSWGLAGEPAVPACGAGRALEGLAGAWSGWAGRVPPVLDGRWPQPWAPPRGCHSAPAAEAGPRRAWAQGSRGPGLLLQAAWGPQLSHKRLCSGMNFSSFGNDSTKLSVCV